ncbi:MAG: DUF6152 family protein [Caulobacteraceae bacterium]
MQMIRKFAAAGLLALTAAAVATPAPAHHSFAMFDREKRRPLVGTVKEFQWTNPHVWIEVNVPGEKGAVEQWGVECTSVNFMTRRGWNKDSLKPGDKISMVVAPLKDGSHGGSMISVTTVNDKPLVLEPEE